MPLILGRPFVDAFLGQHTSALDHAVVEISSPELLDAAGQTACSRGVAKAYDHHPGRDPVKDGEPRVVLRSASPLRTS